MRGFSSEANTTQAEGEEDVQQQVGGKPKTKLKLNSKMKLKKKKREFRLDSKPNRPEDDEAKHNHKHENNKDDDEYNEIKSRDIDSVEEQLRSSISSSSYQQQQHHRSPSNEHLHRLQSHKSNDHATGGRVSNNDDDVDADEVTAIKNNSNLRKSEVDYDALLEKYRQKQESNGGDIAKVTTTQVSGEETDVVVESEVMDFEDTNVEATDLRKPHLW